MAENLVFLDKLDIPELTLGVLDVLVALGITLTNAGILSREQIAEKMRIVGEQQTHLFGDDPSRRLPAETLGAAMGLPAPEGSAATRVWTVDGGKFDLSAPLRI